MVKKVRGVGNPGGSSCLFTNVNTWNGYYALGRSFGRIVGAISEFIKKCVSSRGN